MDAVTPKRAAVAATSPLPLTAIVGIAVGGAVVLFTVLVTLAVVVARRKNRRDRECDLATEGGPNVKANTETTVPTRPRNVSFASSQRLSYNPFMPLDDEPIWNGGIGEDGLDCPPRRKSRRLSATRGPFRISGMRDSWPLVSNIPMSLMPQSSSTIHLNNVAAPGYEIFSEPKWPKRTASRNSRTTVSVQRDSPRKRPGFSDPYSPTRKYQKRNPHVRSASENQLSTILRSTSQRLKAVNKNPLTRTLTSLNRTPVSPPIQPLPRLPMERPNESREQLIESDPEGSITSSVYDLLRSPSSPKRTPKRSGQIFSKSTKSPTTSIASEDSLCVAATSDSFAPAALRSPSKHTTAAYKRQQMRFSTPDKLGFSAPINGDSEVSASDTGLHPGIKRSFSLSAPHRVSFSSDPFFSEFKAPRSLMPEDKIMGPRPLYIRKSTFGADRSSQIYASPLQHISGNAQVSNKKPIPPPHLTPVLGNTDQNPFQWSTQEAMQTRSRSTSPTRRPGHRRSKVVRIVQHPRPMSVSVVPEESEEDTSPNRFSALTSGSVQRFSALEPMQFCGPTPAPLSVFTRRQSTRPPSIATFNPSLNDLTRRSGETLPISGMPENRKVYSPMLVENNYYADSPVNSEEEFFARATHSPSFPSRSQSQQLVSASRKKQMQNRTRSAENLFPSSPYQGKLVSFPAPDLSPIAQEAQIAPPSPRPSPRPLPQISTIYSPAAPPMFMQQSKNLCSPLPPLLTIAIPDHLTGPRAEPTKRAPDNMSGGNIFSPSRTSMQTSVGMLRRMNSDISTLSPPSSNPVSASVSPNPNGNSQILRQNSTQDWHEGRGRSRGSKSYLSMGNPHSNSNLSPVSLLISSSQIRSPAPGTKQRGFEGGDTRDSHRVYEERRRRRNEDLESSNRQSNVDEFLRGRGLVTWAGDAKLTPVKEVVSSPVSSPQSGMRIPGLNLFNAQQKVGSTGVGSPALKLVFPTLTPTGASRNRAASFSRNRQQGKPQREAPPPMSTMMGVGTTADFFKVEIKEVNDSTFGNGSDSDTSTEASEDFAYTGSAQHESEIQISAKSALEQQMDLASGTERSYERDSLLDLYASPRDTPPIIQASSNGSFSANTEAVTFNHPPFTTQPARWSDATPQPATLSVRRESKMEHPCPKSPPSWVWSAEGLGLDASSRTPSPTRSLLVEVVDDGSENEDEKRGIALQSRGFSIERGVEVENEKTATTCGGDAGADTPKSLGLYDSDGFYIGGTNFEMERKSVKVES